MATKNNIPTKLEDLENNKLSISGGTIVGDLKITGDITVAGKVVASLDSNVSSKTDKVIPDVEGNVAILDATGNLADSKKRLNKSVPKDAVFTDTHYDSKNVVGTTDALVNTTKSLTNGKVYLNSVENGVVTSSHNISGSGGTTVTTDKSGNINVNSTIETYYVTSLDKVPSDAKYGSIIVYEYEE